MPTDVERAKRDREYLGLESDGRGVAQWRQRWEHTLVGHAALEVPPLRQGHQGAVQSLSIRPDGRRLASCGDDNTIQLWDIQSSEYLQTLRRDRPYERLNITGIRGVTEAQKATLRALGAIERGALSSTQQVL